LVIRAIGLPFHSTMFRELSEISYLWSTPHAIDGAALKAVIGDLPHTPLDQAVSASLAARTWLFSAVAILFARSGFSAGPDR
jgi:hypothetical protein